MATVLVTGAAGFIGMHVALRLLDCGERVIGLDNLNDYYDVSLKQARLARLEARSGFRFHRADVADSGAVSAVFEQERPDAVVHLAAQAGVRYSIRNPHAYIESNIVGFLHVLEACRWAGVRHLVFASSSSVYGASAHAPFSVKDRVDNPVSMYAATKKSNELMAHVYSHLYGVPATGLRFFTVYGPWGRPDMAYFLFTRAILEGRPIDLFNYGRMRRDFTYIDDIVEGMVRVLDRPPVESTPPYRIYNIGNSRPVELLWFIEVLEQCLGRKAIRNLLPMQPGDVPTTCAEVEDLARDVGFRPETPIEVGLARFVEWYGNFYGAGFRSSAHAAD